MQMSGCLFALVVCRGREEKVSEISGASFLPGSESDALQKPVDDQLAELRGEGCEIGGEAGDAHDQVGV